jgi:hypothetical protein
MHNSAWTRSPRRGLGPLAARPGGARTGFTLIEALCAGLILAVSAVAIATGVAQSVRSLQSGDDYRIAGERLDELLTKVDLVGPSRLEIEGPTEGRFAPPYERFGWALRIASADGGDLYEVTAVVQWRTPRGALRTERAQTLLHDPPGSRQGGTKWEDL